ncbi:MAG: hypothetical protein ACLP1X_25210 [Polyangiaceae bacterium]
MRAFVLQDWLTIRGASTVTSVIMNETQYAQLDAYQDAIFWLQVSEVTLGGAAAVTLNYETAPLKDESLFSSMATAPITTVAMSPPTITKVLLSQNPAVPLSRWVRWRLVQSSSTGWDVTFRLLLVANQLFAFHPAQTGGAMPQMGQRVR